ncbi:unnamed protein product [Oppiella nova]|uniref:Uncharacterized protein n=1 Tax=Oppiella nova TaxID=334625 RepID=A0A7R9QN25_9ACAR|nr:unnamed protein product [Oppiella nova]CAG2168573.1 unnamed protein product [Oppiella nova]
MIAALLAPVAQAEDMVDMEGMEGMVGTAEGMEVTEVDMVVVMEDMVAMDLAVNRLDIDYGYITSHN